MYFSNVLECYSNIQFSLNYSTTSTAINQQKLRKSTGSPIKNETSRISSLFFNLKQKKTTFTYHCYRLTRTARGTTTLWPVTANTHYTVADNWFVVGHRPSRVRYWPCTEPVPGSIDTRRFAVRRAIGPRLIVRPMTSNWFDCCCPSTVYRLWLERVRPLFLVSWMTVTITRSFVYYFP